MNALRQQDIELNQTLNHVNANLLVYLDFLRDNALLTHGKQVALYKALGYSKLLQTWLEQDLYNGANAELSYQQQRANNAWQVFDHLNEELCMLSEKPYQPLALNYRSAQQQLLAPSLWLAELKQAVNYLQAQQQHYYQNL